MIPSLPYRVPAVVEEEKGKALNRMTDTYSPRVLFTYLSRTSPPVVAFSSSFVGMHERLHGRRHESEVAKGKSSDENTRRKE